MYSKGETELAFVLKVTDIDAGMEREYRFHEKRRWRFDFAWPALRMAVEVEGVVWGGSGRHQRASGYGKDCEKYNEALLAGWHVLRVTTQQVADGTALQWIERLWLNRMLAVKNKDEGRIDDEN